MSHHSSKPNRIPSLSPSPFPESQPRFDETTDVVRGTQPGEALYDTPPEGAQVPELERSQRHRGPSRRGIETAEYKSRTKSNAKSQIVDTELGAGNGNGNEAHTEPGGNDEPTSAVVAQLQPQPGLSSASTERQIRTKLKSLDRSQGSQATQPRKRPGRGPSVAGRHEPKKQRVGLDPEEEPVILKRDTAREVEDILGIDLATATAASLKDVAHSLSNYNPPAVGSAKRFPQVGGQAPVTVPKLNKPGGYYRDVMESVPPRDAKRAAPNDSDSDSDSAKRFRAESRGETTDHPTLDATSHSQPVLPSFLTRRLDFSKFRPTPVPQPKPRYIHGASKPHSENPKSARPESLTSHSAPPASAPPRVSIANQAPIPSPSSRPSTSKTTKVAPTARPSQSSISRKNPPPEPDPNTVTESESEPEPELKAKTKKKNHKHRRSKKKRARPTPSEGNTDPSAHDAHRHAPRDPPQDASHDSARNGPRDVLDPEVREAFRRRKAELYGGMETLLNLAMNSNRYSAEQIEATFEMLGRISDPDRPGVMEEMNAQAQPRASTSRVADSGSGSQPRPASQSDQRPARPAPPLNNEGVASGTDDDSEPEPADQDDDDPVCFDRTGLARYPGLRGKVASRAMPLLMVTATLKGAYPDADTAVRWARNAYIRVWKAHYSDIPFKKCPKHLLKTIMTRISHLRSEVKKRIRELVIYLYKFEHGTSKRVMAYNKDIVRRLGHNTFHCRDLVPDKHQYEHKFFRRAICVAFFWSTQSFLLRDPKVLERLEEDGLPLPAVTLVLTMMQESIDEWDTGRHRPRDLNLETQRSIFNAHLQGLVNYRTTASGRLLKFRRKWFRRGLKYANISIKVADDQDGFCQSITRPEDVRPDSPGGSQSGSGSDSDASSSLVTDSDSDSKPERYADGRLTAKSKELRKAKRAAKAQADDAINEELAAIEENLHHLIDTAATKLDIDAEEIRSRFLAYAGSRASARPTAWNGLIHERSKEWSDMKGSYGGGAYMLYVLERIRAEGLYEDMSDDMKGHYIKVAQKARDNKLNAGSARTGTKRLAQGSVKEELDAIGEKLNYLHSVTQVEYMLLSVRSKATDGLQAVYYASNKARSFMESHLTIEMSQLLTLMESAALGGAQKETWTLGKSPRVEPKEPGLFDSYKERQAICSFYCFKAANESRLPPDEYEPELADRSHTETAQAKSEVRKALLKSLREAAAAIASDGSPPMATNPNAIPFVEYKNYHKTVKQYKVAVHNWPMKTLGQMMDPNTMGLGQLQLLLRRIRGEDCGFKRLTDVRKIWIFSYGSGL
ncbi:hypothetical protein FRC12_024834 [Ceratobasidium sp. 428]|nr:hypothetical protein FRC12_024834 [Ceratobasidium sp. 428]